MNATRDAAARAVASVAPTPPPAPSTGLQKLFTGGAVLSAAMLAASAANYVINAFTGRWFDEQNFADATLIVTLFLLVTVGAVALQLMASRRVAQGPDSDPAMHWLRRRAWMLGACASVVVAGPALLWQDVFNTGSALPFVFLGIGLPLYLAQAVDRGVLQGELRFVVLAGSFLVEAAVRVAVTAVLAAAGVGASGVAAALTMSFAATWMVGRMAVLRSGNTRPLETAERDALAGYAKPVAVLLVGQILINNADVLIVKAWLPDDAAAYAAVALIGRAVFFLSWSIVNVLFPVSANRDRTTREDDRIALAGVGIVVASGGTLTIVALLRGEQLLASIIGAQYADAADLLWRYSLATTAFTVANLLASLDLAKGNRRGPHLIAVGAVVQTVALLASTSSVESIVEAQVVVMLALACVVSIERILRARSYEGHHLAPIAVEAEEISLLDRLQDVGVDVSDIVEPPMLALPAGAPSEAGPTERSVSMPEVSSTAHVLSTEMIVRCDQAGAISDQDAVREPEAPVTATHGPIAGRDDGPCIVYGLPAAADPQPFASRAIAWPMAESLADADGFEQQTGS